MSLMEWEQTEAISRSSLLCFPHPMPFPLSVFRPSGTTIKNVRKNQLFKHFTQAFFSFHLTVFHYLSVHIKSAPYIAS